MNPKILFALPALALGIALFWPSHAPAGLGWLRFITDVPTAASDILHGHLSLRSYFQSLRNTRVESVFSWRDPMPSVAEIMMLPYLVTKKYIL